MAGVSRSRKYVVMMATVAFIAIAAILVYFFVWRTSDNDYQIASSHLSDMSTAQSNLNTKISEIQKSANIDDATITTIEESAAKYSDALAVLSADKVVTRNGAVKSDYVQYRQQLTDYSQSVKSLADSVKKYRQILTTCSELVGKLNTFTSVTNFDQDATDCKNTITAAKSAPYAAFNKQFLTAYTSRSDDLVDAYRNQVEIKTSSGAKSISQDSVYLTLVKEKIDELGDVTLYLKPSPDPTDAIKSLNSAVDSQKQSLFR